MQVMTRPPAHMEKSTSGLMKKISEGVNFFSQHELDLTRGGPEEECR